MIRWLFLFPKDCIPCCHIHNSTKLQNPWPFFYLDSRIVTPILVLTLFFCTTRNISTKISCYGKKFIFPKLSSTTNRTIIGMMLLAFIQTTQWGINCDNWNKKNLNQDFNNSHSVTCPDYTNNFIYPFVSQGNNYSS